MDAGRARLAGWLTDWLTALLTPQEGGLALSHLDERESCRQLCEANECCCAFVALSG